MSDGISPDFNEPRRKKPARTTKPSGNRKAPTAKTLRDEKAVDGDKIEQEAEARRRWAYDTALLSMVCAFDTVLEEGFKPFLKDAHGRDYIKIVFSLLSHPKGLAIATAHEKIGKDCDGVSPFTMKKRFKQLIGQDYVQVIQKPEDRRQLLYTLTEKSHRLVAPAAFYAATFITKFSTIIAERNGGPVPIHHPWNYKLPLSENPYVERASDADGSEPNAATKKHRKRSDK